MSKKNPTHGITLIPCPGMLCITLALFGTVYFQSCSLSISLCGVFLCDMGKSLNSLIRMPLFFTHTSFQPALFRSYVAFRNSTDVRLFFRGFFSLLVSPETDGASVLAFCSTAALRRPTGTLTLFEHILT